VAKDNRKIHSSVRMPGRTSGNKVVAEPRSFHPGEEDELVAVLTPQQGERLMQEEAISGDWDFEDLEFNEFTAPSSSAGGGQVPSTIALSEERQAEMAAALLSGTFGILRSSEETASEFLRRVADASRPLAGISQVANDLAPAPKPPLNARLVELLNEHFENEAAARAASDEELLAINGIGPAGVKEIHAYFSAE